jgi:hypothetical protein
LLNRSEQHDDRGDNRERAISARQAAEALFTPKPQITEPSIRETAPGGEPVRKPRVLAVAAATPVLHDEPTQPIRAKSITKPVIPAAHFARIRAWVKYGMTAAQVADVYGAPAGEIERILGTA